MDAESDRPCDGSREQVGDGDAGDLTLVCSLLRQARAAPRVRRWRSPSSASPSIPSRPAAIPAEPWYAIRENYCTAVAAAGGIPVALPHEPELAERYLETVDGLIVTGGAFDVDPTLFGAATRHETVTTKDRRTAFELAITRAAHARAVPSLGICGGQQLMNVALGGSLIQHIPDAVPDALAHEQPNPRTEPGHAVSLAADSVLRAIVGSEVMRVNSAHHQARRRGSPPASSSMRWRPTA